MATGDTVLTDDSLIRRPEGLGIALTVPWYRSLWLSSVSDIAVSVEGREIPRADLRVELGDRTSGSTSWPTSGTSSGSSRTGSSWSSRSTSRRPRASRSTSR